MPTMKFYRRDYLLFQVTVFSKTNYCTSYKNYLHSPNYKSFYRVENIELFGWKVDSSYTRIIFYKIWNNEGKFEKFQFLKEMVLHADWWRGLWVVSSPHAIILTPISYAALCGWVQPTISRETLLSRSQSWEIIRDSNYLDHGHRDALRLLWKGKVRGFF